MYQENSFNFPNKCRWRKSIKQSPVKITETYMTGLAAKIPYGFKLSRPGSKAGEMQRGVFRIVESDMGKANFEVPLPSRS